MPISVRGMGHKASSEISQIIDDLRAQNPLLVVFVAGIIPDFREPEYNRTIELNRRISNMAKSITTTQHPVIFVDHFSGITEGDMVDQLHPNESGAEKIAGKWAEAIEEYLIVR